MIYNPEARDDTIEICVNSKEKSDAKKHCKALGIAVSTWYRNLGNTELQRHGMPPAKPREAGGCRGVGRPANRAGGAKGAMRRHL
jgi:hypothetical protein